MENSFGYSGTGLVTGNTFPYLSGLRPSDVPSSGRADPVLDGEVLVACRGSSRIRDKFRYLLRSWILEMFLHYVELVEQFL
jgi:hypothetical protein